MRSQSRHALPAGRRVPVRFATGRSTSPLASQGRKRWRSLGRHSPYCDGASSVGGVGTCGSRRCRQVNLSGSLAGRAHVQAPTRSGLLHHLRPGWSTVTTSALAVLERPQLPSPTRSFGSSTVWRAPSGRMRSSRSPAPAAACIPRLSGDAPRHSRPRPTPRPDRLHGQRGASYSNLAAFASAAAWSEAAALLGHHPRHLALPHSGTFAAQRHLRLHHIATRSPTPSGDQPPLSPPPLCLRQNHQLFI